MFNTNKKLILLAAAALFACDKKNDAPPMPPPPEVVTMRVGSKPVVIYDEYAAQTEAVESVEIRARVGGILQRQAFTDGATVKKGDLLFIIDPEVFAAALIQAKANLGQAMANHQNSKQNLERLRPLLAARAISPQDLDAAVAKERADAASVEAGKAQVQQAQLNLGYANIRAPRDGMIDRALIKPGGLVNASTTLLTTLYSVNPINVGFTISEQKLAELRKQYDLRSPNEKSPEIKLKLIDGSQYKYAGKLNFISPAVDPRNGTLFVRLVVPNPEGTLRHGEFVRAVVPARSNDNAILIPQRAVQELQGKRSVFVVGPDNKAMYRDIDATTRVGNDWVVEQGLKPGEVVIVDGVSKVKPGAPVRPVPVDQQQARQKQTVPAKPGG
jgi:membrane fusion protein (multidrug efflux system)